MARKPAVKKAKVAKKPRVVKAKLAEGTMVATPTAGKSELGALVSEAMENAIKQAMNEGHFAPQVIKERMMAARDEVIAEWDKAHGGGG